MKHLIALLAVAAFLLVACDSKQDKSGDATATPAPAAVSVQAPSRDTAQGTVELLIQAMRKGDYEAAMLLMDETCDGFAEIQSAEEAIQTARNNPNAGETLVNMYNTLFTRAWQNATPELLGEQEGMSRFRISFEKAEPIEVDVRNATGQWLVICGSDIFVLEQGEQQPEPQPAPPGGDTPTGG